MAEITAELSLKIAGLQAGLERARSEMAGFKKYAQAQARGIGDDFGSSLKTAFSLITTGAISYKLRDLVNDYSHLADISQRFETSPESMQRLEYHARLAGTTLESAATAVMRLQVALEKTGHKGVAAALRELRIDAVMLAGESPEKQLDLLAYAFNRAQVEGRGLSATRELLGKGFAELLPMLQEWREISQEKIAVVSDADVRTLKEFADQWERVKMSAKVMAASALMHPDKSIADVKGSGAQNFAAGAWMGQGGLPASSVARDAVTKAEENQRSWMAGLVDHLSKAEEYARTFNTKLESYRRVTAEAEEQSKKTQEQAAKLEKSEQKARESVNAEEQSTRIQELRSQGRTKEADKLERLKKGQQEFQRLRDAHPEMGEAWALKMAHRKDDAEHRIPGRIQGYKGSGGSKPGEGLDWLYGHNRYRGGQAMNKEFKFPALDEMNRTLKVIEKHLE